MPSAPGDSVVVADWFLDSVGCTSSISVACSLISGASGRAVEGDTLGLVDLMAVVLHVCNIGTRVASRGCGNIRGQKSLKNRMVKPINDKILQQFIHKGVNIRDISVHVGWKVQSFEVVNPGIAV
jgi:hypothetical protein